MKVIIFGFITLLSWIISTTLCLADEELFCPSKVRLISGNVVLEEGPPDYRSFIPNTIIRLTGVTVFDGPPEEGAVLKPSSQSASETRIKWIFEGKYGKGKWFSCDYANGIIKLVKQIREPSANCTAIFVKAQPFNTFEAKLTCK